MSSRENILQNIRNAVHKKYEKPELETLKKHALVYPDVIIQFQSMVKQVGGESHLLNKGEDINDIIIKAYPEAKRIASNISEISCATFNPDDVADPADLDGTDLAIVSGKIGVAENGAVWIEQDVKSRAVYFIAEKLVILLDKENIVSNISLGLALKKISGNQQEVVDVERDHERQRYGRMA